jgi:hypothetical protein
MYEYFEVYVFFREVKEMRGEGEVVFKRGHSVKANPLLQLLLTT